MVLVGDFNIPEFDWNTNCASVDSPKATLLSDIIHDNFLFQLVKDSTRNGNILDLVLVLSFDLVYDLKVGLPFSDPKSISMLLSRKQFPGRKSQKLSYSFKKADWDDLRILFTLHSMALCFYAYWHRSSMGCMVWFVFICCRRVYPKADSEEKFKRTMDKRVFN